MKKTIPILVVIILTIGGIGASSIKVSDSKVINPLYLDELDQYQDVMTENVFIPVGNIQIPDNPISVQAAQSFIPTKSTLTIVELFIIKNLTATEPLMISIREELTEDDLTTTGIDPSLVPTEDFDWVEVDLDDLSVTPGQTYYIVAITENITENYYGWGANNISDSYLYGCAWYSIDEGNSWGNESASSSPQGIESWINQGQNPKFDDPVTWDMCFRTYGTDNLPPETPEIDGPASGAAGTSYDYDFSAVDPDGDEVKFHIDWGDETSEWSDFTSSETTITVSHTWEEQGDYTITVYAQDSNGFDGPESTLPITMPRFRAANNIFIKFFGRHPNIFPILRLLLGL